MTGPRLAVLIGAIALAGFSPPPPACMCSCVDPGTAAEQLARNEVLFVGRVISVRSLDAVDGYALSETTFEVERALKGELGDTVTVRHGSGDSSTCGIDFDDGVEHAILARRDDGALWTGICDRAWRPIAQYEAALAQTTRDPG